MQVFTAPRGFIFTVTFQVTYVLNGEKFIVDMSVHIKHIAGFFTRNVRTKSLC